MKARRNGPIRTRALWDLVDLTDKINDALQELDWSIQDDHRLARDAAKAELRRLIRRLPAITRRVMAQP